MNAVCEEKIVTLWACNAYGMPTFRVHQSEYPEIDAEGRTPAEARDRLIELLAQALEFTGEPWRCQPLRLTVSEARTFNRSFIADARAGPIAPPFGVTRPRPLTPCQDGGMLNEEPAHASLPVPFLGGERFALDETEDSVASEERPILQEWRGRFWLPDSSPMSDPVVGTA
jgi:hypothetical protein